MDVLPFFAIIVLVLLFYAVAMSMDNGRIESYLRQQGGTLLEKSWQPFGPGWFGEREARIYRVRYRDSQGNIHQAYVKTSLFGSVYLSGDTIVEDAGAKRSADDSIRDRIQFYSADGDVQAENERLRRRIEELERERISK